MTNEELKIKIKNCKTMQELDELRMDVVHSNNSEVLILWQKRYRGKKFFRKGEDVGYKYSWR